MKRVVVISIAMFLVNTCSAMNIEPEEISDERKKEIEATYIAQQKEAHKRYQDQMEEKEQKRRYWEQELRRINNVSSKL